MRAIESTVLMLPCILYLLGEAIASVLIMKETNDDYMLATYILIDQRYIYVLYITDAALI